MRLLSGWLMGVCVVILGVRPASAQTSLSANYDPMLHELSEYSSAGGHGDVAKSFGSLAAIGEVGVNHFNQATVLTLAPGVRYAVAGASSRIQPSAQLVLGLWHCRACEVNAFFVQPGVVVDYAASRVMKLRVQFDVRRIFFDFGGETAERLGVGAVWTFR